MLPALSLGLTLVTATLGAPRPAAVATPMSVPFIDDDYTRAVAEARARKVPIFVEAWAPW